MSQEMLDKIDSEVKANDIVLYIRGTKEQQNCGFSFRTVQLFNELGHPFETRNVDANPDLWTSIQEYTKWPTFPQVFVKGEFIGGCDIAVELFEKGELEQKLKAPTGA